MSEESSLDYIIIKNANEHNLKNISLNIPKNKLIVFTGLSGSGKSSLAFDTIYAEGQRRYMESLSSYARQFLDKLDKPDVESIEGLSPTIAIEQRTGNPTPRSTVATTTEIYDYLRVFFARLGTPFCHICSKVISAQSAEDISQTISALGETTKIQILAPIIRDNKGEFKELFQQLKKDGYTRLRIDSKMYDIEETPKLEKNLKHSIDVIIDRIIIKEDSYSRINEAVEIALKLSEGLLSLLFQKAGTDDYAEELFSENFSCPEHGTILQELSPRVFSFNSPFGACEKCAGLGFLLEPDKDLIIPDHHVKLSEGAIHAWRKCGSGMRAFYRNSVIKLAKKYAIKPSMTWDAIDHETQHQILYGKIGVYEGIVPNLKRRFNETESSSQKNRINDFMSLQHCDSCHGKRLKQSILSVRIGQHNIDDIVRMTIEDALIYFQKYAPKKEQEMIAEPIKKAVIERLSFLNDVGLGYLNLNRTTKTLSGGEAQRIRLASQIGAKLSGITYVLDEPTIGLHQRDNLKLISALVELKNLGNTIIVVEHDEDVIEHADHIIDIGPRAGEYGGEITASGDLAAIKKQDSLTAQYLKMERFVPVPSTRRKPEKKRWISLKKCNKNNLKNINLEIPLELLTVVTGISGSGKSTLINQCLSHALHDNMNDRTGMSDKVNRLKIPSDYRIRRVLNINQSPIGRTPRSNPITYIGVFDHIRKLFSQLPESLSRGYQAGRFSFNVKGGRCETCGGHGSKTIEMHFLPSIDVECEACKSLRYNKETLQVKFRGKTIADVLNMPISQACEFFKNHPKIYDGIHTLEKVGLGYIRLGQSSTTLSGGEAQRIKLAAELSNKNITSSIYILDEPTTGLHFHDIAQLVEVIQQIVDKGNTVIIIEHNLDVIKVADWVIDLGPEGGAKGGEMIACGAPETLTTHSNSFTGQFLKNKLNA